MFSVTLYSFPKRNNSTAQPTGGTTVNVVLKDRSSIINPSIGLDLGLTSSPSGYNYAYIPEWGRYYFINNWAFEDRLWWAEMSVDALASWKTQIGASTQYVTRSAFKYNGGIMDFLYPAMATTTFGSAQSEIEWGQSLGQGAYVVGIINDDNSGQGAVSYYVFNQTQFRNMCDALFSNADWINVEDITDITEPLLKTLFNPFQYIVSCMWFPFMPPNGGNDVSSLRFGWWDLSVTCSRYAGTNANETSTFTITKHPQASARGTYLNLAPFSRYRLDFYSWGMIPLDSTKLVGATTLTCLSSVDCMTGVGTLYVNTPGFTFGNVGVFEAQVGVPVQLAQIARDYVGNAINGVGNVAGALASAFTGNIGGAITQGLGVIGNAVDAQIPELMTGGRNGTLSAFFSKPRLWSQHMSVVQDSPVHRGRPLCEDTVISTIPGYIMVSDPDVQFAATETENTMIAQFMEGGFYYE